MENQIQKSDSISSLAKAVIKVMQNVSNIEKGLTVGTGANSYKGVADKDVKQIIGKEMAAQGLCIIPLDVNSKYQIDRWEEATNYGQKQKQAVFVEVTTRYLLMHESGEFVEVAGYGHGVDSQDKSAGKATTYALKNTLLYLFMTPTGEIDDTDKTHSADHETPPPRQNNARNNNRPAVAKTPEQPKMITGSQKVEIKLLLQNNHITAEEKRLMLEGLDKLSFDRANIALGKLRDNIKIRSIEAGEEEPVGNKAPLLKH